MKWLQLLITKDLIKINGQGNTNIIFIKKITNLIQYQYKKIKILKHHNKTQPINKNNI